jgi:hypothetical protein
LSSSLSFSYFSFLLLVSNQNKKKKTKKKDKSIPCVMCITNDDATTNGNKCNNVMIKKKNYKWNKNERKNDKKKNL